ncbi:hypothetical protein ACFVHQ_09320 [Actinomycetes bacterium NPDC127524]
MKIRSVFKKHVYWFHLFVPEKGHVLSEDSNGKVISAEVFILTESKELVWEGKIRVLINQFGIYPQPEDLNRIQASDTAKKMLLIELRRYIKPQKAYL